MTCKNCGKEFEGNFCHGCGAESNAGGASPQQSIKKTKKPIYKKWWFYIIITLAVIFIGAALGVRKAEKIVWNDIVLGELLPTPASDRGKIYDNSSDELWADIKNVSAAQYNGYISSCKDKGFTVDSKTDTTAYSAYNSGGYKLKLNYYKNSRKMSIELEKPLDMAEISWPSSAAGKQLPIPKSLFGKFSFEYDDNFCVYIGNTDINGYNDYVNACSEKGFTVDYSKGDVYYYADNSAGWHISLRYEGNNIMSINIDCPDDSESSPSVPQIESSSQEISSDFKNAMDSYENFMNDYVEFMKKYKSNPSDIGLLGEYADYMSKYADMVKKFDEWESSDMNTAETAYYIEVQARVSKKLLEVTEG